jgi:hypothetical protein
MLRSSQIGAFTLATVMCGCQNASYSPPAPQSVGLSGSTLLSRMRGSIAARPFVASRDVTAAKYLVPNKTQWGVGWNTDGVATLINSFVEHLRCVPKKRGCAEGIVPKKLVLSSPPDEVNISDKHGKASFKSHLSIALCCGNVSSNTTGERIGWAKDDLQGLGVDVVHVISSKLKKGTLVTLYWELKVTNPIVDVSCVPTSGEYAGGGASVILTGKPILSVTGQCINHLYFHWYAGNDYKGPKRLYDATKTTAGIGAYLPVGFVEEDHTVAQGTPSLGSTTLGFDWCLTIVGRSSDIRVIGVRGHNYDDCP